MSSFNRRVFCFGSAVALASCGFTPVYGPGGGGTGLQNAILVDEPNDRDGFLVTREIEDRLGRATNARYGLSYAITTRYESIGIAATNINTRYNILGEVTYALRDLATGEVLTSGKAENFTGYSASGSTVATQSAEEDARERLMVILADQVIRRLEAYSATL